MDENQAKEELGRLLSDGKLDVIADPENDGLVLIEVPKHLPRVSGFAVRELNGKLYYTALSYRAPKTYFEYINDANAPPFPTPSSAATFIRQTAIECPIHNLVVLWRKVGIVHESITSLTHTAQSRSFSIRWSAHLQDGVDSCDVYVRGFNEGIKWPNVAVSGQLRDFEHLRSVEKECDDPGSAAQFRNSRERSREPSLTEQEGYGVFARSISEVLMVAVHAGLVRKVAPSLISESVCEGLVAALKQSGGDWKAFVRNWNTEKLGLLVQDIQAAIVSDRLHIARFVKASELFVLALQNWL